mmetsp:Transcript_29472/g.61838  ORF Transcript_29472/g.61838 Transcript_29472/m.61838 type:complete len:97 (-) Transcript_29472:56-346(-)
MPILYGEATSLNNIPAIGDGAVASLPSQALSPPSPAPAPALQLLLLLPPLSSLKRTIFRWLAGPAAWEELQGAADEMLPWLSSPASAAGSESVSAT